MRLVFCGTPMFAVPCLEHLVSPGHQVMLVITQPDRPQGRGMALTAPPVKQAAIKLGLRIIQPEKIKKNSELQERLTTLQPEAIIVVGSAKDSLHARAFCCKQSVNICVNQVRVYSIHAAKALR